MIHIVSDGNNTAFRANVVTELYTTDGRRSSAIMGTLNATHNVMEELEGLYDQTICEHIYVFDGGHSRRRTELYPEYKANRNHERTPEEETQRTEFFTQVNSLCDNLPLFGLKTIRIRGWEGDDIVYAVTQQIHKSFPDDKVVVVSTDEDFHQLVALGTDVYNPIRRKLYTQSDYQSLMGIPPECFITYKILRGDSSDGIPGIRGIGEKTAKSLVNQYGSLDTMLMPANWDSLRSRKATARILDPEGLSILERNNELINLHDFVDYSSILTEVDDLIDEQPVLDTALAKRYLMSYQLVSILSKWRDWSHLLEDCVNNFGH